MAGDYARLATKRNVEQSAFAGAARGSATMPRALGFVRSLRASVTSFDGAVANLAFPEAARADVGRLLEADKAVVAAVDGAAATTSIDKLRSAVERTEAVFRDGGSAFAAVRRDLALPDRDPRQGPQPLGRMIYVDDFSDPKSGWPTTSTPDYGYAYSGGGLVVSEQTKGKQPFVAPPGPHSFDPSHFTVEADATLTSANGVTSYGLRCPTEPPLQATVDTSGNFLLAMGGEEPGAMVALAESTRPGPAVHAGQVANHLRLDCDQFSDGLVTARLYVNAIYLGSANGPVATRPHGEPGAVLWTIGGAPAAVSFHNWTVSVLG